MIMEFFIEYTGNSEQRTLTYREDEFSFDMEPWVHEIDFEIVINKIALTAVESKVIQLSGFCGLNKNMRADYNVPQSKKGELKILRSENYPSGVGCYGVNKNDWPVYVNVQTGWVCIGEPQKQGNAVEFINNCIAVIDDNKEFISLWLKPQKLPNL